jgi:hypothetical protein
MVLVVRWFGGELVWCVGKRCESVYCAVVLGDICVWEKRRFLYNDGGIVGQWRERRDWRALRDNGEWGAL